MGRRLSSKKLSVSGSVSGCFKPMALSLPNTVGLAVAAGFGLQILTLGVIRLRRAQKIPMGDGNNKLLQRRIRGHANFVEQVPLTLALFALCESQAALPHAALKLVAATFVFGRAIHGYAFWNEAMWPFGRVGGTGATGAVQMTLTLALLRLSLSPAK